MCPCFLRTSNPDETFWGGYFWWCHILWVEHIPLPVSKVLMAIFSAPWAALNTTSAGTVVSECNCVHVIVWFLRNSAAFAMIASLWHCFPWIGAIHGTRWMRTGAPWAVLRCGKRELTQKVHFDLFLEGQNCLVSASLCGGTSEHIWRRKLCVSLFWEIWI